MTLIAKTIIDEALTWQGTPYHANQRSKGIGADCIGLVAGVALAVGIAIPELTLAYSARPSRALQAYLERYLERVAGAAQAGDVLLIALADSAPHHLALVIDADRILHAYRPAQRCLLQTYTAYWRERTAAVYRFSGVA